MDTSSLIIVGTGISVVGQTTIEAKAHMEQAEKLLFLVADPATSYWIKTLNSTAESLQRFYGEDKRRIQTYNEMIDYILQIVRQAKKVCVAFMDIRAFLFILHMRRLNVPERKALRLVCCLEYRLRIVCSPIWG